VAESYVTRRPKTQLVNFYLLKCFTHGLLFTFVFCLFAQFNVTFFVNDMYPVLFLGHLSLFFVAYNYIYYYIFDFDFL
jgi:hypothetical protein